MQNRKEKKPQDKASDCIDQEHKFQFQFQQFPASSSKPQIASPHYSLPNELFQNKKQQQKNQSNKN
jgi:hypothetical protein